MFENSFFLKTFWLRDISYRYPTVLALFPLLFSHFSWKMAKPQNVFLAFWLDDCTCTCLYKHLSRSQWPLDRHGRCNPFPSFYFQLLLRSRKTSTLSIQRYCSPNASFVGPFFSLIALFLVESSWQALMILIHAQTTITCVSLLWLRYHHGAQWLAWFCLWLHR